MSASSGYKLFGPIMEQEDKKVVFLGIDMVTVAMPALRHSLSSVGPMVLVLVLF